MAVTIPGGGIGVTVTVPAGGGIGAGIVTPIAGVGLTVNNTGVSGGVNVTTVGVGGGATVGATPVTVGATVALGGSSGGVNAGASATGAGATVDAGATVNASGAAVAVSGGGAIALVTVALPINLPINLPVNLPVTIPAIVLPTITLPQINIILPVPPTADRSCGTLDNSSGRNRPNFDVGETGGMSPSLDLPLVDVAEWETGRWSAESSMILDVALRTSGFLLLTNHGVPAQLGSEIRQLARRWFTMAPNVKARYHVDGARGWKPATVANAQSNGIATPPDLHETFMIGRCNGDGCEHADPEWFPQNVWPDEVPELQSLMVEYREHMERLAPVVMDMMAHSLQLEDGYFRRFLQPAVGSLSINWYPSYNELGETLPGQYRIGPHSDFGSVTILDRQTAVSGLQIQALDGCWLPAPFVPGALTINIGDLLARWTGDRWRSTKHQVPAPTLAAPDESLLSLVFFYDVDPTAVIETLEGPCAGPTTYPPVLAGEYLLDKIAAIQTA